MAVKQRKLEVVIAGDQKGFSKAMGKAGARSKKFGKSMAKMGKAVGLVFVAMAAGAATFLFKIGKSWDEAMREIEIGTGATGDALAGLGESLKEAVKQVPTDMKTMGNAIATLNTLTGQTGEGLTSLAVASADAFRMLGEDIGSGTLAAGKALSQFKVPMDEQVASMDGLFKLSQDYAISITDLTTKMTKFGPVLSNAGFSFDQTADFMARLEAQGINVRKVMPGLDQAFQRLAKDGVTDLVGAMGEQFNAIKDATSATDALALASKLFGTEGAQVMSAAIRDGTLTLEDLGAQMDGTGGLIQDTADRTATLGEKWGEFVNNVSVKLLPIAIKAFDFLLVAVDALFPAFEKTFDWIETNVMPVLKDLANFAQAAKETFDKDGLGGLVGSLKEKIGAALPGIMEKLGEWAGAFVSWVGDAIPPLLQKAAVLLTAIGDWIVEKMPVLRDKLFDTWLPAMTEWLAEAAKIVLPALGTFIEAIVGWLADHIDEIVIEIAKWAVKFVEWIALDVIPKLGPELVKFAAKMVKFIQFEVPKKLVGAFINIISAFVGWVAPAIVKMTTKLWDMIVAYETWVVTEMIPGVVKGAVKMAIAFGGWAVEAAKALPGKMISMGTTFITEYAKFVRKVATVAFNLGSNMVKWIMEGLSTLAKKIAEAVVAAVRTAITVAGDVARTITGTGGVTRSVSDILGSTRALPQDVMAQFQDQGGVISGAIGSPQLVVAHGGETVLPTHRGNRGPIGGPSMMRGGGANITINVSAGAVVSDRGLQDIITDALQEAQRSSGALRFTTI